MEPDVLAVIEVVPALRGREVAVKPLGGGLTNRNYRVDAGGESFVLRIAGAASELLLIDRTREVASARTAAAAGVGPEVIAYLPEHGALVTRFHKGRQFAADDMREPAVLRGVAASLRRYHGHSVPEGLASFCPFDAARRYHRSAVERHAEVPADLGGTVDLLDRIELELRTDEPRCLCHNDLLAGNFIGDGTSLRIIDWEYAGLGDRCFDLGNFAAHARLTDDEERLLAESYFGAARPDELRRLRLMRLVSDLREATWGYLQSCISRLNSPQYYREYGRQFLDRFLAAPAARELAG